MNLVSWAGRLGYVAATAIITIAMVGCTTTPSLPEISTGQNPLPPVAVSEPVTEMAQEEWDGPKELEIKVLHKANYNPFERNNGKSFRALNSIEKYRIELEAHSIETAKPVDYKTSQILVSSIGEKPTGGYKVTATKAEEFEDRVVVTVIQSGPGPSCITTQALTHPFEFVVIPSLKPIEIFERQKLEDC